MTGRTRVLVVYVDALGPTQWSRFSSGKSGFSHVRSLRGELGYSSGALATVLTGASPLVHGRMCLFSARDPSDPPFLASLRWLGLLPRWVHERGVVRRAIGRWFAEHQRLTGYFALHKVPPSLFSWLDVRERDDLFSAETIGASSTFLSRSRAAGLQVYATPWQLDETTRMQHALEVLRSHPMDLAFLYTAGLDGLLHAQGNDAVGAQAWVRGLESTVERARDAMAKHGGDVRTLVIGDHGMADIHEVIDPKPVLSNLGSLRVFCDSTMMRIWGTEEQLKVAEKLLMDTSWPGAWLAGRTLSEMHVPMGPSGYADALYLLGEGAMFAPNHLGGAARGMHGYCPNSPSAQAALVTDFSFASSATTLRDVAPIVCGSLGLVA